MKNYIKMLLIDSVPAIGYTVFTILLAALLSGCGHNIYLERETTGFRLDIPMGDSTVGFAVGSDKTVRATVRGGASFETSSSNGGGLFSGTGGQSKITQFKSHAQLNEGNLVEVFTSTSVPDAAKMMLASNLSEGVNAPYFPGSILQTKESTIHIGRVSMQSNNVAQIQDNDKHGLDLLVDRTSSVIGTNIVNHTLDTTKNVIGTNIVNQTISSTTEVTEKVVDTTASIIGTNVANETVHAVKDIVGTNIVPTVTAVTEEIVNDVTNPLKDTVKEVKEVAEEVDVIVNDIKTPILQFVGIIALAIALLMILNYILKKDSKPKSHKHIHVDADPNTAIVIPEDLKESITATDIHIQTTETKPKRSLASRIKGALSFMTECVKTLAGWILLIPPDTRKQIFAYISGYVKTKLAEKKAKKSKDDQKKEK